MIYSDDFWGVKIFVHLLMKYHLSWGLTPLVVGCSTVRGHCCKAQLELELLHKAFGYLYTTTLIMPVPVLISTWASR